MRKNYSTLLFLTMSIQCQVSFAEENFCMHETENDRSLHKCSRQKLHQADNELKNVYERLVEQVHSDYRADEELGRQLNEHIKISQLHWLSLRTANCWIESFPISPGTLAFETATNDCLAREAISRAIYLGSIKFK